MSSAPRAGGARASWATNATRRRTWVRPRTVALLGAIAACGLLLFPFAAGANHQSDAFFIFSKAEHGKFAETNCDGSNDKQADISGSFVSIHGRVHSNADFAASGQNVTFNDPVTFGTFDGAAPPCQSAAGSQNTYLAGAPTNLAGAPPGLNEGTDPTGGWPGNLNDFLSNSDELTFSSIGQVLPGKTCDVGSLSGTSDITLTAANNGQVVCNGTGKVQLGASGQSSSNPVAMSISIVSHGSIEISGQHLSLSPASHGVLALTDESSTANDVSIKLSGSNLDVPNRGLLFTPRSGQDISGSVDSELCIQVVGQGRIKVSGSASEFGPGLCESSTPTPEVTLTDFPDETTAGQNVAYSTTLTNVQSFAYADVRFRSPIPTTIVNGSPVKAVLKYASCDEQLTATELVCDALSTLGPGESAEVTVVWQTPASGSSLTGSGTWTIGAEAFPTGTVVTPLLSPSDPDEAATYALTTCTNASTQSTLATNQTLGIANPLATKVCAPSLPLGDPLNPGLVASVEERDHLPTDPGITQVSSICLPAPGQGCTGSFPPFVFSPTLATFTFTIDNRSLPVVCTTSGGRGEDDDDDDDDGDGCKTERIDKVFHDGVLVSSSPTADPRVVSITVNNSKQTTTVVVKSSENGFWDFI